jgi:hypothetical protein
LNNIQVVKICIFIIQLVFKKLDCWPWCSQLQNFGVTLSPLYQLYFFFETWQSPNCLICHGFPQ